jgi:Uma2 family endonuclease
LAVQIAKHLFDISEYHRLAQAGIFSEDDRVELIKGEVIEMSPIGSAHAACVSRLDDLLHTSVRHSVQIRVQNPLQLDDFSEPEPDIALVRPRKDHYALAHPRPEDVLSVIEIADTSIEYDRHVKLPMYARAGIPEAWLIDLNQDVIGKFSEPRDGQYPTYGEARRGETIASTVLPTLTLAADDIL